jgi:hypothetical protein
MSYQKKKKKEEEEERNPLRITCSVSKMHIKIKNMAGWMD